MQIAAILLLLAASLFGAAGASAEVAQPFGAAGEQAFSARFAADGDLAAPRSTFQASAPRPAWASDAADEPEPPLAAAPPAEGARAAPAPRCGAAVSPGCLLDWLEADGHLGVPPPAAARGR